MTREAIAARIRAAEPRVAWDWSGGNCHPPTVLDVVAAEVEKIVVERTADLCAEVHRLTTLLDADTRLLKSDLIRTGDENFTKPAR